MWERSHIARTDPPQKGFPVPTSVLRRALGVAATALLLGAAGLLVGAPARADTQLCARFATTTIQGGHYVVQNNRWNDAALDQCINVTATGFAITSGNQNVPTNGAPASYPSVYAGCHYGACSTGNGLPLQISAFGNPTTAVSYHTTAGQWDAAYDIWFDPTPNPAGQNHGTEIMIWGSHAGAPQPVGSRIGTASLAGATWDVWSGNLCGDGCWNVNSFVRQQTTNALNINIRDFVNDSVNRGITQRSWYLTSVQFGFEPWQGGPGLGVDSFSFTANGPTTPPTTQPPPTTTPPPTTPPSGGGCRVTYVPNEWQGGLTGNLTVANTGSAPVTGWTLRFAFRGDQAITSGWSAVWSQAGTAVTARNMDYNATIPPGGSVGIGFQGTWHASDAAPNAFTLNGTTCT
jgi:hypothetical protein